MNLIYRFLLIASFSVALTAGNARADLVIDVGSGLITPGGTLTLGVTVRSETDTGPFNLSDFLFELRIVPNTALSGTSLGFASSDSENFLVDPDYIFFDNSDVIETSDDATDVFTIATPFDSLRVSDAAFDVTNVSVGTDPILIAQLEVRHNLAGTTASTIGNSFNVLFLANDSDFLDADGFDQPFSGNNGLVTVAVPEPSSIAFLVASLGGVVIVRCRRKKSNRSRRVRKTRRHC